MSDAGEQGEQAEQGERAEQIVLRNDTLPALAERGVTVPTYDRSALTAGIAHVGVGGFHRAHQAMIVDDLLQQGLAADWAICGFGLMPKDASMKEALDAQDGLYTLVLKHPDGSREVRVIGSIVECVFVPADPAAAVERMASPEIRIVSLTVTEGGYNIDRSTGEWIADDPAVTDDLRHPDEPATVFGLVTAALARRRERGVAPFTVMTCDNVPGNGEVAAMAFTSFARQRDPDLADWIASEVAFPNSMVDRITPVTADSDRAEVRERWGIADEVPVVAEPFFQWVLQDAFGPTGDPQRPAFEKTRVQLVDDVEPYELMKLRLLNAGHQALAYVGYLSGYRYAHEAMADPQIAAFVRRWMDDEGTPTLPEVPGVDLTAYKDTLIERFANPEVRDTLARLCLESSDRIPPWVLPAVRDNLAAGRDVTIAATMCAAWARYSEGVDERGEPIDVQDRHADTLVPLARSQGDGDAFIRNRPLFGDLADEPRFAGPYLQALASLHARGAHATVSDLVSSG